MKPLELQSALKRKEYAPLYFFYGDETFLIDKTVELLKEKLLDQSLSSFNLTVFYGRETTSHDIINTAKTLPLQGNYRLVLVKEADQLKSSWKDFASYFAQPVLSTCLIFCADKMVLKSALLATFKKQGIPVRFYHPYDRDIPGWIRNFSRDLNKKMSGEAVALLNAELDNGLQNIYNEIEKIATYVGERPVIERDDVKQVIAPNRGMSIFTLTDSIASKDVEGALRSLKHLLEEGEYPLKILMMITRQVRLLARAKEMVQNGCAQADVGKTLGIRDFYLRVFIKQVRAFSLPRVENYFSLLFYSDWKLKSSRVDKRLLLEDLVIRLCAL
jgi:DNA polymerase-3 subunit delta